MKGIDYGFGRPKPANIKKLGYDFVCRYLSHTPSKNLMQGELLDLRNAGLIIVVVWETTTQRPLAGYDAGVQDAVDAIKQLKNMEAQDQDGNLPVIYFALDDDFGIDNLKGPITEYFKGITSVLPSSRVGVYGGILSVRTLLDSGLVSYAWQTLAWSHKQWDERAQLRQVSTSGPNIDGVECDTNETTSDDFGGF